MPRRGQCALHVVALAVIAGLVLVAHRVGSKTDSILLGDLLDRLHIPGFAAITLLAVSYCRYVANCRTSFVAGALIATGLALFGELSQISTSRNASLGDLFRDAVGIGIGCYVQWRWNHRNRTSREGCARLAADAVIALIAAGPVAFAAAALYDRAGAVPTITTFDRGWQQRIVSPVNADIRFAIADDGAEGAPSYVDVTTLPSGYGGVAITDPAPDWRGFQFLAFSIRSVAEPSTLALRIHDGYHTGEFSDRFNTRFEAPTTWRRYCVRLDDIASAPAGRRMDMTAIDDIVIFRHSDWPGSRRFHVGRVYLLSEGGATRESTCESVLAPPTTDDDMPPARK